MAKTLFSKAMIKSPSEHKATAERTAVVVAIQRICDRKKEQGQVPARATWRELRDVLTIDEQAMLKRLVENGVIDVERAINWDTYKVNYKRLYEFESFISRLGV